MNINLEDTRESFEPYNSAPCHRRWRQLGLVGAFEFDLVAALFGDGSAISRLVYVLVGLSALWQIVPFVKALSVGEVPAEGGHVRTGRI